ncbi:hypothetical protein GCM10009097_42930 [Pigmentiphaga daeguensis]|uniref:Uncharacterized protein n=1 Tax=Pigmentiphaga daeguensis TaxID=414049 RepID=A0ABN1CK77_9BURK
MQFDEPAQAVQAALHVGENIEVELTAVLWIERETHPSRASLVQFAAQFRRTVTPETHHGQIASGGLLYRVHVHFVVETMGIGMNDETVIDAQSRVHLQSMFERRVWRCVFALARIWKAALRPQDVEMRIPGSFR